MGDQAVTSQEVFEGTLDGPDLTRVLRDIELCADVIEVRVKGGPQDYADANDCSFAQGSALLRDGRAVGLQIRYRHDGTEWWDTILRGGGGYRLIRTRVPDLDES